MSYQKSDKDKILDEIFARVPGMITRVDGERLFDLAANCKRGVIVEIGCADGRSTICLAKGSKSGLNIPVYSVDPHIGGGSTPDPTWFDTSDKGTPDAKYYTGQGTVIDAYLNWLKEFNVDDIVRPIIDYSEPAYNNGWDNPICLLFIDGDHRYNYVKLDVTKWGSHIIPGGVMLMHDSSYSGVKEVIECLVKTNPKVESWSNGPGGFLARF